MIRDIYTLSNGLWVTIFVYGTLTAIFIIGNQVLDDSYGNHFLIGIRAGCLALMISLVIFLPKLYTSYLYPWIFMLVFTSATFSSISAISFVNDVFTYVVVLEVMYLNLMISYMSGLPFGHIVISSVFTSIGWISIILKSYQNKYHIETVILIFVFIVINLAVSYMKEHYDRKTYNLNKLALREIENTDKLLTQMMPPQAIKNFQDEVNTTDKYSDITILYANICGFTQ